MDALSASPSRNWTGRSDLGLRESGARLQAAVVLGEALTEVGQHAVMESGIVQLHGHGCQSGGRMPGGRRAGTRP